MGKRIFSSFLIMAVLMAILAGGSFAEEGLTVDTNANVGIGTNAPAGKLHVYTASDNNALVVTSTGRVGIGVQAPDAKLEVLRTINNNSKDLVTLSGNFNATSSGQYNNAGINQMGVALL